MNTLPISAASAARGRKTSSDPASAVPTSTGEITAGRVRGRAAASQMRSGTRPAPATRTEELIGTRRSRPAGEPREVRLALLDVRVSPFLAFLRHIEEHRRIACEPLKACEPVAIGIGRTLQEPERERLERRHLARRAERAV